MEEMGMQIEPVTADVIGGEMGKYMQDYARRFLTTLMAEPVIWHRHLIRRLKTYGENPIRIYLGMEPVDISSGPWKIGQLQRRKVTDEEIAIALEIAETLVEAADLLGINQSTLYQRLNPEVLVRHRRKYGSPEKGSGDETKHQWAPHEDELVLKHNMRDALIGTIVGVSQHAVRTRRYELKKRAAAAAERVGAVA